MVALTPTGVKNDRKKEESPLLDKTRRRLAYSCTNAGGAAAILPGGIFQQLMCYIQ
jgi:hypothetical protein